MDHTIDYKSETDINAIVSLFKYGKGNYKSLAFAIFLILLASACLMVSANLMGRLAEAISSGANNRTPLVVAILIMELFHLGFFYFGRVKLAKVTNQVALGIRTALFVKIGKLPIQYFDENPLGRTVTRLTSDVEGIESFFSNTLPRLITATITIIAVLTAILFTDLNFGFIICLSSLPAIIFTVLLRKPVRHWLRIYKQRSADLNTKLAELINGLAIIKIFGLETWSYRQFETKSLQLLSAAIRLMNWNSLIRPIAAMLCVVPILIILWWGGHQVLEGAMNIGLLIAFVRYAERYFRPIMMISFELHLIQDAMTSSERIKHMLEHSEEDQYLTASGRKRARMRGHIEFHQVKMSYYKDQDVLHGVSFKVFAGQKVALVGKTGSGKSTTIHLLPQLYPFHSGSILIDGIALEDWSRHSIREQLGIVSQEVMIFHGTIRDNLRAALPQNTPLSDAKLLEACALTGLDKIIDNMPQKLDTELLDNGSNLSMGERQMIAFTRMLIRKPSILILDEATANIDQSYEKLIQSTLDTHMRSRTCFIIAHRLNTIKKCDKILVFEKGKIIESGTHDELILEKGCYAHLVERQLS